MPRLLTTKETAEKLRVNESTVRRYLRNGLMRGSRLGRVWCIAEPDLQAFLARSQVRVSGRGFLANLLPGFSTEEFLKDKRVEIELEEEKFRRNWGKPDS